MIQMVSSSTSDSIIVSWDILCHYSSDQLLDFSFRSIRNESENPYQRFILSGLVVFNLTYETIYGTLPQ